MNIFFALNTRSRVFKDLCGKVRKVFVLHWTSSGKIPKIFFLVMARFSQELPREKLQKMYRFSNAEYILNQASAGNILPRIVLTR